MLPQRAGLPGLNGGGADHRAGTLHWRLSKQIICCWTI